MGDMISPAVASHSGAVMRRDIAEEGRDVRCVALCYCLFGSNIDVISVFVFSLPAGCYVVRLFVCLLPPCTR